MEMLLRLIRKQGGGTVVWQQLTSKQFAEGVVGHADTVLVPVGSVEAHGLHLPLGSDNLAPESLCQRVERHHPDRIVVAPTMSYGHGWELAEWPGSVSLSSRLVADYAAEVGRGLAQWGMRQIVFVNGHAGNIGPLIEAQERIAERSVRVLLVNWWLDFGQEILAVVDEQGHAGEDETSVMLAVQEELVHLDEAMQNPHRLKWPGIKSREVLTRGFRYAMTGSAKSASREKGEAILALVESRMLEMIEDLWADRVFDERRD